MASSTTPEDTEIDKIIVFDQGHSLSEISLSSGLIRELIKHDYRENQGCSFSPLVDNRYVYKVGGENQVTRKLTSEVFYYDLSDPNRKRQEAPSIRYLEWEPTLIVLGSKLFSFTGYKSDSEHISEVLDTASEPLSWRPLKISPNLPFGEDDPPAYFVVSYATHMNNLFLSLGNDYTSFAVCYNVSTDTWCNLSEKSLPFYRQGKFVKDDICYGFSKPDKPSKFDFLTSCKLSINWETSLPQVSCQELVKYSIPSTPPPFSSYLHSFFVSSSQVFTIVKGTRHFSGQQYSLDVYVVQLVDPTLKRKRRPSPPPPPPTPIRCYYEDYDGDYDENYYKFREVYYQCAPVIDDSLGSSKLLNQFSISFPQYVLEILGYL